MTRAIPALGLLCAALVQAAWSEKISPYSVHAGRLLERPPPDQSPHGHPNLVTLSAGLHDAGAGGRH